MENLPLLDKLFFFGAFVFLLWRDHSLARAIEALHEKIDDGD